MRGPKAIPNSIKRLAGDGVRDSGGRIIPDELKAEPGAPDVPCDLAGDSLTAWHSFIRDTNGMGADPVIDAQVVEAVKAGEDTAPAESNPNPTPDGDKLYDDGPAVPADEIVDIDAVAVPLARALKPIAADVVARLMRREAKAVGAAVVKHSDPAALSKWLDTYSQESRRVVTDALAPVIASVAALSPRKIDVEAIAAAWVSRTRTDIDTLVGSDDRETDFDLMTEGWKGDRTDSMILELLGENAA